MKPKNGSLLIGLILAIVATVLLLAIPSSANLYVAYAFCLLGIAALVVGVWAADKKDFPATYAVEWQTAWLLPVSVVVSAVVLLLQGFEIYTLATIWHVIIQVALLSVVGIRVISVYTGKEYIQNIDAQVAKQTGRLSSLVADVNALQSKADKLPEEKRAAAKQAIKKVAEALRYSDPMSTAAVQALDEEISEGVRGIADQCVPGSEDELMEVCDAVCAKIRERNERLKADK